MGIESQVEGNPVLESNRLTALNNLRSLLETPEEQIFRTHQLNMFKSYHDFLTEGGRAGFMSEATGSGKSAALVKIAEALGLKTIILSPTIPILLQNAREAARFAPHLRLSNYYSDEKDLSGTAINTTYQSVVPMLRQTQRNGFRPDEVGLIICDEAHLGLGEIRHTIYRQFPNALFLGLTATPYFEPLEGFQKRGLVKKDEKWTGLFTNLIHELTLEEAIERAILTQLDIRMLQTNTRVENISVQSSGEYSQEDIEKYFSQYARSALAIGMIAGIDNLPLEVRVAAGQRQQLAEIHQAVKGKKTLVFGISIAHVEELGTKLRSMDIKAVAVHSQLSHDAIAGSLEDLKSGKVDVILGVDLVRLGLDLPSTEVTIHMRPWVSSVAITQELGRGLRISPQTGKEKLIAIQLVDQIKRGVQPVLIPHLFSQDFILRGSQTGAEKSPYHGLLRKGPIIQFSGMDIQFILEQARSQQLLHSRFQNATVLEMNRLFDSLLNKVCAEIPNVHTYSLMNEVAQRLPGRIPFEAQLAAISAIKSDDGDTHRAGAKAFLLLNLKTVIRVVDLLFDEQRHSVQERDEMTHTAIARVLNINAEQISSATPIHATLHQLIQRALVEYMQDSEQLPTPLGGNPKRNYITSLMRRAWVSHLSAKDRDGLLQELAGQTGASRVVLADYAAVLNTTDISAVQGEDLPSEADEVEQTVGLAMLRDDLEAAFSTQLSPWEQEVLTMYYGIGWREPRLPLRKIAHELGLTSGEGVRQIMVKAIRKLRKSPQFAWHEVPAIPKETVTSLDQFGFDESTKSRLSRIGIFTVVGFFTFTPEQIAKRWGEDDKRTLLEILAAVTNRLHNLSDLSSRYIPPATEKESLLLTRITNSIILKMKQGKDPMYLADTIPLSNLEWKLLFSEKSYWGAKDFTPQEANELKRAKNLPGQTIAPATRRARQKMFCFYYKNLVDYIIEK